MKETNLTRKIVLRDTACHPSDAPGWWEWWYFDADFENGYTVVGTFHFGSPRPPANRDARFIEIALYDPSGEKRTVRKRYLLEQCSASEDTCKVSIGPNIFEGDGSRFHVFFEDGKQGCDLVYESQVDGFIREPFSGDTASGVGTDVGWLVPAARAEVKGTITYDGKTMQVTGRGYHDHNWADAPMSGGGNSKDLLALMGLIVGDWTLVSSGGSSQRKYGNEPYAFMYAFKGRELVAVSEKGGGQGSDHTVNEFGVEYPCKYRLWWDEPGVVEGEINMNLKQVIDFMDLLSRFKPFQRWFTETYVGRPAYFRFRLDYDVDLTIRGERKTGNGHGWCEYHRFV